MNIAVIGTGLLGKPIALRLLQKNHRVSVFNRTKAKAISLEKDGAVVFDSFKLANDSADCMLLLLSDIRAIEEVLFSDPDISFANKTIIQMGTISPEESIELQKKIFKRDGEYIEAPVLGSIKEATDGTLIIMVGATQDRFDLWQPFLKDLGPNPRHLGEVGKAALCKLALNQLIAGHNVNFALSLKLIEKGDVDLKHYKDIVEESALTSPMFEKKLPRWEAKNFSNPNFPVKHLLKDVELVKKVTGGLGLFTDSLDAYARFLEIAIERGYAEDDYSAVLEAIEKKND